MIIQCEKCLTKFEIDGSRIQEGGSKVRCSRCGHVFVAFPQEKAQATGSPATAVSEETFSEETKAISAGFNEQWDFDESLEEDSIDAMDALDDDYEEDFYGPADHEEDDTAGGVLGWASGDEKGSPSKEEFGAHSVVASMTRPGGSRIWLAVTLCALMAIGTAYLVIQVGPGLVSGFLAAFSAKNEGKGVSADAGASRLAVLTVNGSFVESKKAGRLFVIRGKVVNNYSDSRSFLCVKGSILDDTGRIVKEQTVYGGNPLWNEDLATLSIEEIRRRMSNRNGVDNLNTNVEQGKSLDFAIVFEQLPNNVSQFEVGAVGSSPTGGAPNM
jgi:predicted Zn finger-like uncharacterized protein